MVIFDKGNSGEVTAIKQTWEVILEVAYQIFKEQAPDMKILIKSINENIRGVVISEGKSIRGNRYRRWKAYEPGDIESCKYRKCHTLKVMIL